jgi:CRISPR/Cas system CMR-associated protein Cmr5 small subunit
MTRQQRWAKLALERVRDHKGMASESKYKTLCMKMPSLLKQSGLVQSLAFMRSREEGKKFCDELATTYGLLATNDKRAGEVLQDKAQNAERLDQYLVLSRDLIDISVWFRRFAQSELADDDKLPGGADAGPT